MKSVKKYYIRKLVTGTKKWSSLLLTTDNEMTSHVFCGPGAKRVKIYKTAKGAEKKAKLMGAEAVCFI